MHRELIHGSNSLYRRGLEAEKPLFAAMLKRIPQLSVFSFRPFLSPRLLSFMPV
jgi:hypothetical protein